MNSKFWVGLALIIAIIMLVNIFAFGYLPDYLSGKKTDTNSTIITTQKSPYTSQPSATQTTGSQTTQPSATQTATTPPAGRIRVTRAS